MSELDRWKGRSVRLKQTIKARVVLNRTFVMTEADAWGRKLQRKVNLMKGEVFIVIGHYKGRLDLLYQPRKMPEKVILHVPLSALEENINGRTIK